MKQLGIALLLAANFAWAADPVTHDAKFDAAVQASKLLKSDDNGALNRGIKRVAIAAFDIEFLTKGSASASATEIGKSGTARQTTIVSLAGIEAVQLQAMVDKAYADFAAQLQAAGFELVPTATVLAAPAYRKLAASGGPAPFTKEGNNETSVIYTPEGRAVYGFSTHSKSSNPLAALSAMSTAATFISAAPDLQKELDATLLNVQMVVRFVEMSSSSSSLLGRISGSASVSSKVSPTLAPESTHMMLMGPKGTSRYQLSAPLQISGAAIPELKDTSSAATNIGLAVLSMAIGTGSSSKVNEKQAVADPAAYRSLVGDALGGVGSMMVEQLKALR